MEPDTNHELVESFKCIINSTVFLGTTLSSYV